MNQIPIKHISYKYPLSSEFTQLLSLDGESSEDEVHL